MEGGPQGGPGGPMDGLGPVGPHSLVVTLIFSLLLLVPVWRTYARAGLSPWFSLLVLVPYIGLPVAAAILAFRPWPNGESRRVRPARPRQGDG